MGVFVSTGAFTDKHYASVWVSLAGDGVSSSGAEATFAASANFIGNFLKFFGRFGNGRIILLVWRLAFCRFALGCEAAGEEIIHLSVLANDFRYIRLVFHLC